MTPSSRAAAATAILNVEPGEYRPCSGAIGEGARSSVLSAFQAARSIPVAKAFGSYAGTLASASTSPLSRIQEHRAPACSPSGDLNPSSTAFCRSESIVSFRRPPSVGRILLDRADLPADAVDDDQARAVLAHQHVVVRLLDAGLPDDVAALQAFVAADLRVAGFADVPEQVRGERRRDSAASALPRPPRRAARSRGAAP